jgi:hypothetical protein
MAKKTESKPAKAEAPKPAAKSGGKTETKKASGKK